MANKATRAAISRIQAAVHENVKDLSPDDYRQVLEEVLGEMEGRMEALDQEQEEEEEE